MIKILVKTEMGLVSGGYCQILRDNILKRGKYCSWYEEFSQINSSEDCIEKRNELWYSLAFYSPSNFSLNGTGTAGTACYNIAALKWDVEKTEMKVYKGFYKALKLIDYFI